MYDPFELPVDYNGEELSIPAQLVQAGFQHKFLITVNDQELIFEPDEEGKYRAVIIGDNLHENINPDLLKAISDSIDSVLK